MTWREKWQQAYEKASFYRTEQNSSEYCNRIVALDYSKNMLEVCKKRLDNYIDDGVSISYVLNDFNEYETDEKFDIVLSCLNPSTYVRNIPFAYIIVFCER